MASFGSQNYIDQQVEESMDEDNFAITHESPQQIPNSDEHGDGGVLTFCQIPVSAEQHCQLVVKQIHQQILQILAGGQDCPDVLLVQTNKVLNKKK